VRAVSKSLETCGKKERREMRKRRREGGERRFVSFSEDERDVVYGMRVSYALSEGH
jgi:CelD/BcsL family acetyltransferase involved in cellulose biosynthesis